MTAGWYPDGSALLVGHGHAARSELYRYDLATGALERLDTPPGVVRGATARPDGTVELAWSSSARPPVIRRADGPVVLSVGDEEPPAAYPVEDRWVQGPGGDVHALLVRPAGPGPYATAFLVHGGPDSADDDSFRARRAAWVDAGYAVVQVNYRGLHRLRQRLAGRAQGPAGAHRARGHRRGLRRAGRRGDRRPGAGAALRRLLGRVPHAARPRHPARALGRRHRRGAGRRLPGGVRGRDGGPEGLRPRAVRRFAGGGARRLRARPRRSPTWTRSRRRCSSSPGANDPRCPIRQIDNYLDRLAELGKAHEVYRYDAGHGSLVVEETIRQAEVALNFALRTVPPGVPSRRVPGRPAREIPRREQDQQRQQEAGLDAPPPHVGRD